MDIPDFISRLSSQIVTNRVAKLIMILCHPVRLFFIFLAFYKDML